MKITALTENICGNSCVEAEHGLSLLIESEKHNILFDTGASGLFAKNALALGKNIEGVDIAVISHGHYDHGGGIEQFLQINKTAPVYISRGAFSELYRLAPPGEKYIGIDRTLSENERIIKLEGSVAIDEELSVFTGVKGRRLWPLGNRKMRIRENGVLRTDDFSHEQNLVVNSGSSALFAGCSHNGAVNIIEEYIRLYGKAPEVFVGGFHFRRDGDYTEQDVEIMRETARYFRGLPTVFYTCHCTGTEPYKIMKKIMGDKLIYLKCGDTVTV